MRPKYILKKKNILIPDRTKRQIVAPFDIVIKGFRKHSMHGTLINFLDRNNKTGKDRGVNNFKQYRDEYLGVEPGI